ncbi:prepilin-type N-terminal cleavage/methylation domain-containing protein [Flavimobilis soli]|uniref:Prepilin-type N-terminal cleavage/methylation domain-containing protein n=1 Tax=Flavimobilis soli TaxID=442709 RepID=A0A2A9EAG6_9MICO|nr:Ig-like domain-containing protein [Flavimobilis soli]PFG35646.1 prepilin-type N-terminal cleavage/methylation domain-containing protein [Flavimobilis soli]
MRRNQISKSDEGFSLIEVIVALFIVGMVAAAVLVFFMRGSSTASHLQRTQNSASVATQAMEKVRSVYPRASSPGGTTPLVIGRTKAAVNAAFSTVAALDPDLVAETNQLWDPIATGGGTVTLPISHEVRVSDMKYDVTTLIGSCYRAKSASASDTTCVRVNPGAAYTLVYRAIVAVAWDPGMAKCGGDGCFYTMTSLIDPTSDAVWNVSTAPVANDDSIDSVAGGPSLPVEILKNDVIVSTRSNPTTITSPPSKGTATVITSGTNMGAITYTPPANYSGIVTFRYKLRDAQGRNSNEATVTVLVYPAAVDDTGARVGAGSSASIDVLANDLGTDLRPEIIEQSPRGHATVNPDGTIQFAADPSAPVGNTTFKYRVVTTVELDDGTMDLWSDNPAQVPGRTGTVTVRIGTAVAANDAEFIVDGQGSTTSNVTLDVQNAAGGSASNKVVILSGPTRVDATGTGATTLTGSGTTTIRFKPAGNTVGVYTFTFQLETAAGDRSETQTGTILVVPVAKNYTYTTTVKGATTANVSPLTGNIPNAANSRVTYAVASAPTCTRTSGSGNPTVGVTLSNATNGTFAFRTTSIQSNWRGSCTFTYTVTYTGGGQTWTSAPATVTLNNVRGS